MIDPESFIFIAEKAAKTAEHVSSIAEIAVELVKENLDKRPKQRPKAEKSIITAQKPLLPLFVFSKAKAAPATKTVVKHENQSVHKIDIKINLDESPKTVIRFFERQAGFMIGKYKNGSQVRFDNIVSQEISIAGPKGSGDFMLYAGESYELVSIVDASKGFMELKFLGYIKEIN